MDVILGYLAGLLTLINPCVLPILPIVLATALQAGRAGPVALAAGMSVSFVALGLLVSTVGYGLGLDEVVVSNAAAVMMILFGTVLLVPQFSARFATATAGVGSGADATLDRVGTQGVSGQFMGGLLLGAVWSPCIGPTLGGAISLAAQGESLVQAGAIMASFALGVSTIILVLAYGAQSVLARRKEAMMRIARISRPVMGAAFVIVGFGILFKLHHVVEIWVLDTFPAWFTALSVSI
jgi:cytochrome c biogenesis protein CcdA